MTDIKTGPDFAFPMEDAPKDGSILRLLVKFDRKSAAGAFEDTTEPSWTIGTNNKANTGEDQWDIVGWSWEQDVFCHAYGAKAIGWLPFHTESNEPTALPPPSPAPAESGAVAWRVKDFADGWVYHTDEARALRLAAHMSGALVQPLYTHPSPAPSASMGRVTVEYDGFVGTVIGSYVTREGKRGVVVQQDGTRVVHVYGEARVRQTADLDSPPDHGGGEGGVLVPREPTRDMLTAFVDADTDIDLSRTRYHAMLASLPPQESEDGR